MTDDEVIKLYKELSKKGMTIDFICDVSDGYTIPVDEIFFENLGDWRTDIDSEYSPLNYGFDPDEAEGWEYYTFDDDFSPGHYPKPATKEQCGEFLRSCAEEMEEYMEEL